MKAKNHGIVNGTFKHDTDPSQDKYSPKNHIIREALATLFVNILKEAKFSYPKTKGYTFKGEADFSFGAAPRIYIANANCIGEDRYNPKGNATIQEAVCMLVNMQTAFEGKGDANVTYILRELYALVFLFLLNVQLIMQIELVLILDHITLRQW